MNKLSPIEQATLRLRCVEVALIAAIKLDFTREDGLVFAEKVWDFVNKVPPEK